MNSESEKAKQFINKLLANPSLKGLSSLQKEEQILQFLNVNGNKLYPTLSSSAFFPHKNIWEVNQILISNLYEITNSLLMPHLRTLIYEKLDYSFFSFLNEGNLNEDAIRFQIFSILDKIMKQSIARRNMVGAYSAVSANLVQKYLEPIFERRKYIFFELTKVQKLRMSLKDMDHFISLSMLIRPTVYLLEISGDTSEKSSNKYMVKKHNIKGAMDHLKSELNLLPESILYSGLHGNLSFNDNKNIEITARLSAVFSTMGLSYNPSMKIDRGAVGADSSWYNISRKNHMYNGFDRDLLKELYNISVENGW